MVLQHCDSVFADFHQQLETFMLSSGILMERIKALCSFKMLILFQQTPLYHGTQQYGSEILCNVKRNINIHHILLHVVQHCKGDLLAVRYIGPFCTSDYSCEHVDNCARLVSGQKAEWSDLRSGDNGQGLLVKTTARALDSKQAGQRLLCICI